MPKELYVDKVERLEGCKCKEPLSNDKGVCLNCGGTIEAKIVKEEIVGDLKKSYTLAELLKMNFKREWLVKGFLHPGDTWLIKAQKKVGKSMLAQIFVHACSTGTPFLGQFAVKKPLSVAYIFSEGSYEEWAIRSERLKVLSPYNEHNIHYVNADEWDLTEPEGRELLLKELVSRNVKFDLLAWDCLYMFIAGGDLNSGSDISLFYKYINMVRNKFGAANLVIHHDSEKIYTDSKGQKHSSASVNNAMGHTSILSFPTHYHTLMEHHDSNGKKYCKLKKGKCRTGDIEQEIDLFMVGDDDDDGDNCLGFVLDHEEINRSYILIRDYIKKQGVVKIKGLRAELKIANSTFAKHRDRLLEEGKIVKDRIGDQNCYVWKGGVE